MPETTDVLGWQMQESFKHNWTLHTIYKSHGSHCMEMWGHAVFQIHEPRTRQVHLFLSFFRSI